MRKYISDINQNYSLIKLTEYAVILSTILLTIDLLNLPLKYLLGDNKLFSFLIAGAVIILLILKGIEFGLIDTLKLTTVNIIDAFSVTMIFSSTIYLVIASFYGFLFLYKSISLFIIVIIFFSIILGRSIYLKKKKIEAKKYTPNIVDLKDIYNGNFNLEEDQLVLIKEEEVNYDLLERENIINQLYNAILQSKPDGKFVISLEGGWGSGKTTIINNVKKQLRNTKEDIIIIDEFDPWSYSDQRSLFYKMFDIIIKKSGLKYNTLAAKKMAEEISENIFGTQKSTRILKTFFENENDVVTLKNKINDYLRLCGKKVVFFIDNIDRIESGNIILLFKLVGNILDFNRVTYVLSYDNDRIRKIFDNDLNIDYKYLKKVIQMQIRVPEVNENALNNLFKKSLNNLLIEYGEDKENLNYYDCIINFMCEQKIDVRDFKRFINSVIGSVFSGSNYLNKRDLVIIEYIRLYNISLYQKIYKNSKFFVSHDKKENSKIYTMSLHNEKFNQDGKEFFKELFSDEKNNKYKNILAEIFPYVKKYSKNQDLENNRVQIYDGSYPNIIKNKRICSGKYFDLYFTNTKNDFILIGELIENFIDNLNQTKSFDKRKEAFKNLLDSIQQSYQREMFERFEFYIEDLKKGLLFDLVNILFDKIYIINNISGFFALSARSRVEVIIWELLQKINEEEYDDFLDNIKVDYGKIKIISSILYWFNNDREGKNIEERKEKMQLLYEDMGSTIIENNINLYNDSYYFPKNIWGLARLYEEDQEEFQNYIKNITDKDNIFRLIYDCISLSYGKKFRYSIRQENLENLTTEEHIDNILEETEPSTPDQKFILRVYENYKNNETNRFGEKGIILDELKNINL
ncbi:KAP family P-loop NTPase fold protein [Halanaerobium saccharolyticum]|uniref:KAP family P-loop NTPase fold protein n=1 Tax=Halanaerobium saccharolyticum TaxID=43595 RepID=UPI003FCC730C